MAYESSCSGRSSRVLRTPDIYFDRRFLSQSAARLTSVNLSYRELRTSSSCQLYYQFAFFVLIWYIIKQRKFDMGTLNPLWFFVKKSMTVALFGITISDRYATVYSLTGTSMSPTFTTSSPSFPGYLKGDIVLVEKFCLETYKFSCGDVIAFKSPSDHKREFVKRVVALPGDWMQIPDTSDILKIPEGHCWVEGDNKEFSLDSRHFGPIPLGLVQGRVTHVVWPPQRIRKVERKFPRLKLSAVSQIVPAPLRWIAHCVRMIYSYHSAPQIPVMQEESGDEELSLLPRHTKVIVTGNNRTKSVLVGLQGVVKKAVGLGGWHWLVLKNGEEVKLQRNALSVLEAPTGNEDDEVDCDTSFCSSSDMGEKDMDCKFHKPRKSRIRHARSWKSNGQSSIRDIHSNGCKPRTRVRLSKLETTTLWRYWKHFNLVSSNSSPTKEQLIHDVQHHFLSQKLDEREVILGFIHAAKRLRTLHIRIKEIPKLSLTMFVDCEILLKHHRVEEKKILLSEMTPGICIPDSSEPVKSPNPSGFSCHPHPDKQQALLQLDEDISKEGTRDGHKLAISMWWWSK
ncbi:hypothetical protein OPV22_027533 [Ensete ventricosum]|uniref:Mitochondrial inner membrane protease subunit 2 n=1 Tax=Ensete ventricosum TaxID=4639 RepID=A0AAV8PXV8_ENSVE|nr:hypothetical protein OPV22_027533 [Ensete ventricosum]